LNGLIVFSGNSNPELAKEVAKQIGTNLGECTIGRFADFETLVRIETDVRDKDVYVVQSTCNPVNENLMELLVFIDALKRASAGRITAVIPWYGYARQDYKSNPQDPISAKLVANLITTAGADRVVAVDLHSKPIQGFFDIPVENLSAIAIQCDYLKSLKLKNLIAVSPDAGGVKRARKFAKILNADMAVINKYRPKENVAEVMSIIGDVKGKNAVIVDDMVDTAGTLCEGAKALKKAGANKIYAVATHAPLSGPAISRIRSSDLEEVIITDTIPFGEKPKIKKIVLLSVAPILAEVINRMHTGEPVYAPFSGSQTNISGFI